MLNEAGQLLARREDLLSDRIALGFPSSIQSDNTEMQTRRITGLGRKRGVFSVADEVYPGMPICVCRRDGGFALNDAKRALTSIQERLESPPCAGILFSHKGRNHGLLTDTDDARLVQTYLGKDFPLFAVETWGEIMHTRLHTESATLALLL